MSGGRQAARRGHGGIWKTLRITFSLRNTYRVNSILHALKQINSILHALKQIPLVGRVLPETLYQERGLKILANVISALWELTAALLGKGLYFLILLAAVAFYPSPDRQGMFLYLMEHVYVQPYEG